MVDREAYMREALLLACEAEAAGEVPVGCVVVCDGRIVGRGKNACERLNDPAAHAEMIAIRRACAALGDWRLPDCTLYVTLEPCPMCAGAIINARVGEVVYGASDPAFGAVGGVINLFEEGFGHRPRVFGGVLEEACAALLSDFFRRLRQ